MRLDIVLRVSSLNTVQPAALKELNQILEKQFSGNSNAARTTLGGIKRAADIMNFLDSSVEGALMDAIREVDSDLSEQIEDLMFVFNNLADVDDRGIQALLREVSSDVLVVSLKGADERVKDKIFKNMSKRASELLRDDLEAKGRCGSATWKRRRRKSSPSPAAWPRPARSCSAARVPRK